MSSIILELDFMLAADKKEPISRSTGEIGS